MWKLPGQNWTNVPGLWLQLWTVCIGQRLLVIPTLRIPCSNLCHCVLPSNCALLWRALPLSTPPPPIPSGQCRECTQRYPFSCLNQQPWSLGLFAKDKGFNVNFSVTRPEPRPDCQCLEVMYMLLSSICPMYHRILQAFFSEPIHLLSQIVFWNRKKSQAEF